MHLERLQLAGGAIGEKVQPSRAKQKQGRWCQGVFARTWYLDRARGAHWSEGIVDMQLPQWDGVYPAVNMYVDTLAGEIPGRGPNHERGSPEVAQPLAILAAAARRRFGRRRLA